MTLFERLGWLGAIALLAMTVLVANAGATSAGEKVVYLSPQVQATTAVVKRIDGTTADLTVGKTHLRNVPACSAAAPVGCWIDLTP